MYVRMYAFVVGDNIRRDVGKAIKYLQLASHGGKSCDMHEGHVTVTPFPCMYVHVRMYVTTDHLHALYMLGIINAEGNGVKRSCNFGVEVRTYVCKYVHT